MADRVVRAGREWSFARHRCHGHRPGTPARRGPAAWPCTCRPSHPSAACPGSSRSRRQSSRCFCTLRVNRPNCPRYMVVGPPLVSVTAEIGTVTVCASWQFEHSRRAVGQRAGVGLAAGVAARTVVPPRRAGHVRERGALLRVRIELRLVGDDEALRRTDHRRGAQHVERQRTGGRPGIADRVVRAGRRVVLCPALVSRHRPGTPARRGSAAWLCTCRPSHPSAACPGSSRSRRQSSRCSAR